MQICHLEDFIFTTFSVEFCPLLFVRVLIYFFSNISDLKGGEIFSHTLVSEKVMWKNMYELMLTVCKSLCM